MLLVLLVTRLKEIDDKKSTVAWN